MSTIRDIAMRFTFNHQTVLEQIKERIEHPRRILLPGEAELLKFEQEAQRIAENTKDLDLEIDKLVNEHFEELFGDDDHEGDNI